VSQDATFGGFRIRKLVKGRGQECSSRSRPAVGCQLGPLQAASARATSSPHGGPGELRGTSTGDSAIRIHAEVNTISVKVCTFLPDRGSCMKASRLALLPSLLLLVSVYFHTEAASRGGSS